MTSGELHKSQQSVNGNIIKVPSRWSFVKHTTFVSQPKIKILLGNRHNSSGYCIKNPQHNLLHNCETAPCLQSLLYMGTCQREDQHDMFRKAPQFRAYANIATCLRQPFVTVCLQSNPKNHGLCDYGDLCYSSTSAAVHRNRSLHTKIPSAKCAGDSTDTNNGKNTHQPTHAWREKPWVHTPQFSCTKGLIKHSIQVRRLDEADRNLRVTASPASIGPSAGLLLEYPGWSMKVCIECTGGMMFI